MQKSYWTYQKRDVDQPWAVNAILTYPRGHKEKSKIAFDIYSECIANSVHCITINEKCYLSNVDIVSRLIDVIGVFSTIVKEDEAQLTYFINHILPEGI